MTRRLFPVRNGESRRPQNPLDEDRPDRIDRTMTRRQVEIESLATFDAHIQRARRLSGWFVRAVDLTARTQELRRVNPRGAAFVGCRFARGVEAELTTRGAMVFPDLPDLPFQPYRPGLYDADELYGDGPYAGSPDAAIYAWSRAVGRPDSMGDQLAIALHDHAISDALDDATRRLNPRTMVGVMGGHGLVRGDPGYRAAMELGSTLARAGRTVLTGGGPGAMEAANLGAYLSAWPDAAPEALSILSEAPSYSPLIDDWLGVARAVRLRWPAGRAGHSLSIPTWFYGHEPTNVFATMIAKYFTNALREDTLLHRCRGGIVYLPGKAGTVQEIFQAGTENFYAADPTLIAPMILVGLDYWTNVLPAWELLQRLGTDRPMASAIHCVDSVEQAISILIRE
jgi:predicted Rossmann-fold nucleotide-binding protein